jgi:hypothetical protein
MPPALLEPTSFETNEEQWTPSLMPQSLLESGSSMAITGQDGIIVASEGKEGTAINATSKGLYDNPSFSI